MHRLSLACVALAFAGCGPDSSEANSGTPRVDAAEYWFEDATERFGITFRHSLNSSDYYLPDLMGPGCALFDADGDGDLDAYFVDYGSGREGAPNRFMLRDGERFRDATDASGLGDPGFGQGVAVGDFDNDGDLDVYVTNYGPNALYRNRGDGTFENVTASAGVAGDAWSTSAAFVDYDTDGDLDIFVANYLVHDPKVTCPNAAGALDFCGPRSHPGISDSLFRNDGDGTFTDISEPAGLTRTKRRGLGVIAADLDGDGQVEIYVANDNDPNHLWTRKADGTLSEDAMLRGLALNREGREEASMGIICEDLDGDLDLDLFITHLRSESNTAYFNQNGAAFDDQTARSGLMAPSLPFTGFGTVAIDFDQDGHLDIATVNGRVMRGPVDERAKVSEFWRPYAQIGQLFRGRGKGAFDDHTPYAGVLGNDPQVGRALAAGDIDGDGTPDLLMTSTAGPARLLLTRTPDRGHWLIVRALDADQKRDAIGAKVEVVIGDTGRVRRIDPAHSYISSSDPRAHFGLGAAARFDALHVVWPGGTRETFAGGDADRVITVERGKGSR